MAHMKHCDGCGEWFEGLHGIVGERILCSVCFLKQTARTACSYEGCELGDFRPTRCWDKIRGEHTCGHVVEYPVIGDNEKTRAVVGELVKQACRWCKKSGVAVDG